MDSVKKLLGLRSKVRGRHKASDGDKAAGETEAIDQEDLYVFTLKEIELITQNFSRPSFCRGAHLGIIYEGFIDDNLRSGLKAQTVGINKWHLRHPLSVPLGHREWLAEVMFVGRLRHPHLVKLIGYCYEDEQRMIICEYAYGRLRNQSRSFGSCAYLPWSTRMKIALGVAKGLSFLHEYEIPVTYRDFDPSFILLDLDYNAKLSELGLFRSRKMWTNRAATNSVYTAPESVETDHLTAKSNVYSFGVLLAYFISGAEPLRGDNLLVSPRLKDAAELAKTIDPKLEGQYSMAVAQKVAALAYQCLSLNVESINFEDYFVMFEK